MREELFKFNIQEEENITPGGDPDNENLEQKLKYLEKFHHVFKEFLGESESKY